MEIIPNPKVHRCESCSFALLQKNVIVIVTKSATLQEVDGVKVLQLETAAGAAIRVHQTPSS